MTVRQCPHCKKQYEDGATIHLDPENNCLPEDVNTAGRLDPTVPLANEVWDGHLELDPCEEPEY